jgi:hypothetical protein
VQELPKRFLLQMSLGFCPKVSPALNLTDTDMARAPLTGSL